ncbi:unnamed protein product [Eruca vesicaria subsp. sativa]|uniref:USP domain-containing protein n=1 Tax=Eruca vesicaria subsp. sativa TaxID=29727 RepID=A0ABC8LUZ2_ERUVS|nr:unnamed protein product [Eruca vesicaria subsp. sativa]
MRKGQVLEVSNMSIEELGLHMTQDILLEVDGSSEVNDEQPLEEKPSGLAGLVNLGNTCYMNSALQCLAHTPPILEYFLRVHSKDELAKAFGELLKELCHSGSNAAAPRVFKTKLSCSTVQWLHSTRFSSYRRNQMQKKSGKLKLEMLHGGQGRSH